MKPLKEHQRECHRVRQNNTLISAICSQHRQGATIKELEYIFQLPQRQIESIIKGIK